VSHLSAEELVDAVEGTLAPVARTHLESCPACGQEVAQLSAVLAETARVAVPEPSPLFWKHFSTRVRDAIVAEPHGKAWLPRWFEWPVLAPLAGLGVLVLALMSAVDRSVPAPHAPDAPGVLTSAASASARGTSGELRRELAEAASGRGAGPVEIDSIAIDTAWEVLSDVVGPLDVEAAQEAGIATALGTADRFVLQLTQSEQEELVQLLQQEVGRVGS
jgi:hypothetical protein